MFSKTTLIIDFYMRPKSTSENQSTWFPSIILTNVSAYVKNTNEPISRKKNFKIALEP